MPADQLVTRMLSSLGRIDQTRIRTGKLEDEDWPKLTTAVNIMRDKPLFIDDHRRYQSERDCVPVPVVLCVSMATYAMIMVDYLQLMQYQDRQVSRGRTAGDLRDLALPEGAGEGAGVPGGGAVTAEPFPGATSQQTPGKL